MFLLGWIKVYVSNSNVGVWVGGFLLCQRLIFALAELFSPPLSITRCKGWRRNPHILFCLTSWGWCFLSLSACEMTLSSWSYSREPNPMSLSSATFWEISALPLFNWNLGDTILSLYDMLLFYFTSLPMDKKLVILESLKGLLYFQVLKSTLVNSGIGSLQHMAGIPINHPVCLSWDPRGFSAILGPWFEDLIYSSQQTCCQHSSFITSRLLGKFDLRSFFNLSTCFMYYHQLAF